jgi:uncharacterized protein (TIGR02265 family)
MSEQLVFHSTMDVLVKAAGTRVSDRCVHLLKQAGFDIRGKLKPAYPSTVWAESVRLLGEDLFPGTPAKEAHRQLGITAVDLFAQSMMGSALFGLLRLLGPTRTIARMTHNLKTGANYLETRATQKAPNTWEIWLNEVNGMDGFYKGFLECGLKHVGAVNPVAQVTATDGHACTYLTTWDAQPAATR